MKRIFALLLALLVLASCGAAAADWQEQYDLGIRYLSEQNYSEAILAFTAAIEVDPNRQELYIGRAQAYIASGETEENLAAALADYEKAKELGYTDADLWLGMADIYIRQGDYDKALEILQEGLEATGGDADIQAKIDELESGTVTDSEGKERKVSSYDGEGNLVWFYEYRYDPDGTPIEAFYQDFYRNASGTIPIISAKDGKGYSQHIESVTVSDIDSDYKNNITYDFRSVIAYTQITSSSNDSGVNVRYEYTYLYDGTFYGARSYQSEISGENTINTNCILNEDNSIYHKRVTEIGPEGKTLSSTEYDGNDELLSKTTYEYDEQGKILRSNIYDQNGILTTIENWEYDDQGREVLWSRQYADGFIFHKTQTEYFEGEHYITHTTIFNRDGSILDSYSFEYDGRTLIQKTNYNPDGTVKEVIEY